MDDKIKIEVIFFPDKGNKKIYHDLDELKQLFISELEFWKGFERHRALGAIYQNFQSFLNKVNLMIELGETDSEKAFSVVGDLQQLLISETRVIIYSNTTAGLFLKEQADISAERGDGAFDGLWDKKIEFVHNKLSTEYLRGLISGFLFKDFENTYNSIISSNIESLSSLKEQFSKDKNSSIEGIQNIQNDFDTWKKETIKIIEKLHVDEKEEFENLKKSLNYDFLKFSENWQSKYEALENAYDEQLKLQQPAKYWEEFTIDYMKKGKFWMGLSVLATAVLAVFLGIVLYNPPEFMKITLEKISANSIKSTLILAVLISSIVYIIRLFVKLSLSAYHLARDSRERHQLTMVFLALIKEGGLEPKDRDVILQSLFSRADTGLLKDSGTPAIPGEIGSFLKNISVLK